MDKQFILSKVVEFNGYTVNSGEVSLTSTEYCDILDEIYEPVSVCGYTHMAGSLLESANPVAFNCGKSDYEGSIQADLEYAIDNEDWYSMKFEDDFNIDEYLENEAI